MFEYTLEMFNNDVEALELQILAHEYDYDGIYGIPQGGVPLAIILSEKLNIPLVTTDAIDEWESEFDETRFLIVDDLVDSGGTIKEYAGFDIAVLGHKGLVAISNSIQFYSAREFPKEWINFWWEPIDTKADPESLVIRMLEYIGEDPTRSGLVETPKRVVKMWGEIFGGLNKEKRPRIQVVPNGEDGVEYDEMLRDSGYFFSCCEHHLIPFFGQYYFGYIPDKLILGASKIGRLIDYYANRPQIAERLVNQVINDIEKEIHPKGSILVMNARHLCKEMRGLKKWNSPYEAIATRGLFRKDVNNCKLEFMSRLPKE